MHVLSLERRAAVVSHLTDCGSVRATSRQTGVHKTTILSLILKLGEGCRWLHNRLVRGLHVGRVEADEMHSYVHTREQNLKPLPPIWAPASHAAPLSASSASQLSASESTTP
jgi:hypothetical protein